LGKVPHSYKGFHESAKGGHFPYNGPHQEDLMEYVHLIHDYTGMHGWMDARMDGLMDGGVDGWMDGWMDG